MLFGRKLDFKPESGKKIKVTARPAEHRTIA
jgi:hypothetical protein